MQSRLRGMRITLYSTQCWLRNVRIGFLRKNISISYPANLRWGSDINVLDLRLRLCVLNKTPIIQWFYQKKTIHNLPKNPWTGLLNHLGWPPFQRTIELIDLLTTVSGRNSFTGGGAAFCRRDPFFGYRFVKPVRSDASIRTPSGGALALVISGILEMILQFCWEANFNQLVRKTNIH